MRKLNAALGLELYAALLAGIQSLGGVRTDEAKYLLNIPYPHPPFLRFLMGATEGLPLQEMLWRFLLASLFLQAVWLVWDMGRALTRGPRIALCAAWLLSGGVILLSGGLLLAPVNAVQALAFLWLLSRPAFAKEHPLSTGLFWILSLFTAYQAVLYLPIIFAIFQRMKLPAWQYWFYVFAPVALLALYTLSNPLAVASITHHGGEDLHSTLSYRTLSSLRLWLIAGSGVASVLGTWGLLVSRRRESIASFALVSAFVLLNRFEYYSILFTPLLLVGLQHLLQKHRLHPAAFVGCLLAGTFVTIAFNPIHSFRSPARQVMTAIEERRRMGDVLIAGTFGHEWQYESSLILRAFRPDLLVGAQAVVCLAERCPVLPTDRWIPLEALPARVWVKN